MLVNIILALIAAPFVWHLSIYLFWGTKKIANNVLDDITRPDKGRYNINLLELSDIVCKYRICRIKIDIGNSRCMRLKHLSNDFDSYKTTCIEISSELCIFMKRQIPKIYSEDKISGERFTMLLPYLLSNFKIISFTDYPKDPNTRYSLELIKDKDFDINSSSQQSAKDLISKIDNNLLLYEEYTLIDYRFKDEYVKLIKANNWLPLKKEIPQHWKYDLSTRKGDKILDSLYDPEW